MFGEGRWCGCVVMNSTVVCTLFVWLRKDIGVRDFFLAAEQVFFYLGVRMGKQVTVIISKTKNICIKF